MSPKSKTVLLLVLCFALGILAGYIGERYYFDTRPPRHPDYAQARKEFAQRLHLDTLQLVSVDSLMDAHRKRMDDIRKLFAQERDTLRAGIRKLLRPDQDLIYEDFVKSLDAKRHESDRTTTK
jgi:hypothetical protein